MVGEGRGVDEEVRWVWARENGNQIDLKINVGEGGVLNVNT